VSIWKWVQKYSSLADRFKTNRYAVKEIFVDETLLQIDGQDYWLWIAYEPNIDVCLSMHLSRERTIFVCYRFFLQLRRKYGRKPIFTDGAHTGTKRSMQMVEVRSSGIWGTELKNLMERFIQQIKDRTECFDDHFPCRK
jgi:putative transposase